MARKRKKKGRGQRRGSITALVKRHEKALEAGNTKKAGRIADRISKKALENPAGALPAGQQYAWDEFQKNLAANRAGQEAIGGSREYVTDPVTGQVTAIDTLSPEQQALYDQQAAQVAAANEMFMAALQSGVPYGAAFDFSGAPEVPSTEELEAQRQEYEDALFDEEYGDVKENYDVMRAEAEQRLYEQGHAPGSPRFKAEMDRLDEQLLETEQSIRASATERGAQEYQRLFNLGQQGRQAYIQEQAFARSQPLSELAQLGQFGGGPTMMPEFFGFQPIQYQGPDYLSYLQTGLEAELGRGQLGVEQQLAGYAAPTGGGAPPPMWNIGGAPPPVPNVPAAPDPVAGGFGSGFQVGTGMWI